MATKSIFKRWDGTQWVEYYFKTSADLIDETTTYKVLTATERTAISTYLTTFNAADKLVKINAAGAAQDPSKIDRSLIGDLSATYLTKANPAFTGTLTGPAITITGDLSVVGGGMTVTDSQGGFLLSAYDGATLKMDQAAEFNSVVSVSTPTLATHAATKGYVDGLVSTGLHWAAGGPVKAATTGNITLSGLQSIDGYTTVAGDRILVKSQSTASQNGIYTASATAWTKVTADSSQGNMVFVENGSTYNDWSFQATSDTVWSATSKVDSYQAGTGLTKTGLTFSISSGAITNDMLAGSITQPKLATFTSLDNANASYDTWAELVAASTDNALTTKLNNLFAAIGLARGTANYNTANTETIAGAYDLAEVKNRTYQGTAATPTGLTLVTGDLYFYELA